MSKRRSRGSFGQWTTEQAPAGGVRDVAGRDLVTLAAIDGGPQVEPTDPQLVQRRRRRGRR